MTHEVSNTDDVIDSRDVIERIAELETEIEQERELLADHPEPQPDEPNTPARQTRLDNISELETELNTLKELAEEAEGYAPDWQDGATLIRDSYFTDYAKELLEDCGDLPKNLPSYVAIDWEKTAENIRVDYTSIEFDGTTYWVR